MAFGIASVKTELVFFLLRHLFDFQWPAYSKLQSKVEHVQKIQKRDINYARLLLKMFFCLPNRATEFFHTLPNTFKKTLVHFFVTKTQFFPSNKFSLYVVSKIGTPLNRNKFFFFFPKNKINEWTAHWCSVVIRSTDRKRMFSDRAQHKSMNRPTLDHGVYAAENERANCLLIRAYQIPKGKKAADGPTVRMHTYKTILNVTT